eukprot:660088-Pleurochrysis_carterae.AAC.1
MKNGPRRQGEGTTWGGVRALLRRRTATKAGSAAENALAGAARGRYDAPRRVVWSRAEIASLGLRRRAPVHAQTRHAQAMPDRT